MNKNKKIILSLVLVVTLVMGLGVGVKLNNKKYEDKKQNIIETKEEVGSEGYEVEITKVNGKKMVVIYDYMEEEDMGWCYPFYKELSEINSNTHYSYSNEKEVDVAHVYLGRGLDIHFISVNGINVYENGDDKESNEYYEPIYKTIIEKTFGGKLKEI